MRLARYYDAIIMLAPADAVNAGLPAALPSPEVIYCAQPRTTPLRQLRDQLERFRSAGAVIRGIVLWDAERPVLENDVAAHARQQHTRPPQRVPVGAAEHPDRIANSLGA